MKLACLLGPPLRLLALWRLGVGAGAGRRGLPSHHLHIRTSLHVFAWELNDE